MKGQLLAAAVAASAGGVSAGAHQHAHDLFHLRRGEAAASVCTPGCTTIYTYVTGEPTRMLRCCPAGREREGEGRTMASCSGSET